jgi:carboxypeptidase family protein
MPPGEKKRPVTVALVGAGALILAALIGVWGTRSHADSSTAPNKVEASAPSVAPANSATAANQPADPSPSGQSPSDKDDLIDYSGTVRDAKTKKAIGGAKVAITEDQDVPQRLTTDSEGVFYAKLHKNSSTILLTVDAVGYKEYTRRARSVRTGGEDILLEPEPQTQNIPFEDTYPAVGGHWPQCSCIADAHDDKGLTITNNCPGPVPLLCVKDTQIPPPGHPANFDMLLASPGRKFAHTTLASGESAFFDASGKIGGGCQYFACPGTNAQPSALRCQVGPLQPPPVAACYQNSGFVGQQCTCPNGLTGILTQ